MEEEKDEEEFDGSYSESVAASAAEGGDDAADAAHQAARSLQGFDDAAAAAAASSAQLSGMIEQRHDDRSFGGGMNPCLICEKGPSPTDNRAMVRFLPTLSAPQDISLHVFCGKTASILPNFNMPQYEILTKAGIKNKHGIGPDVNFALAQSRSAESVTPSNANKKGGEKQYFLVKEFEAHLNTLKSVQIHSSHNRYHHHPTTTTTAIHHHIMTTPQQQQHHDFATIPLRGVTHDIMAATTSTATSTAGARIRPHKAGKSFSKRAKEDFQQVLVTGPQLLQHHHQMSQEEAEEEAAWSFVHDPTSLLHSETDDPTNQQSHQQQQHHELSSTMAICGDDETTTTTTTEQLGILSSSPPQEDDNVETDLLQRENDYEITNDATIEEDDDGMGSNRGKVQCSCGGYYWPITTTQSKMRGSASWKAHLTTKKHRTWANIASIQRQFQRELSQKMRPPKNEEEET